MVVLSVRGAVFRISVLVLVFIPAFCVGSLPVLGAELRLALCDSTCSVTKEVGAVFSRETGISLNYTCKSSGMLVGGMQAGILKADFFMAASKHWMDRAVETGLVGRAQVHPYLTNSLIVVSRHDSQLALEKLADLASPQVDQIIIGDPSRAPFGRYAKQAMQNANLWEALNGKVSSRKKISLAVESLNGEGPNTVAILHRTELRDFMRLQLTIPQSLTSDMAYYFAPTQNGEQKAATQKFIEFLQSDRATQIYAAAGFGVQRN